MGEKGRQDRKEVNAGFQNKGGVRWISRRRCQESLPSKGREKSNLARDLTLL